MMMASMAATLSASTLTRPKANRSLSATCASTPPVIRFSAHAPAPATPTPVDAPAPMATEAAKATTSIVEASVAVTAIPPTVASTSASSIEAWVSLSMMLRAKPTPIATATPTVPKDAATEAAPAKAWIDERLSASSVTLSARIVVVPSFLPSMTAATSTPMRFSAHTPEPAAATPTVPPTATATEPAKTSESMLWSASANSWTSPPACTVVSISSALTSSGVAAASPGIQPMKFCATAMPIDTPMPAVPPPPMATDAATTVEEMDALLIALRLTSLALLSLLLRPWASVPPSTTF